MSIVSIGGMIMPIISFKSGAEEIERLVAAVMLPLDKRIVN